MIPVHFHFLRPSCVAIGALSCTFPKVVIVDRVCLSDLLYVSEASTDEGLYAVYCGGGNSEPELL